MTLNDQRAMPGSFRSNSGITLLELMFAGGVLAITLSILFGALIALSGVGEIAEGRTRASATLSSVLEEVRSLSYDEVLVHTPAPVPSAGMEMAVLLEAFTEEGDPVLLPLTVGTGVSASSLPNPLEVRATVLWSWRSGRIFSASSSTFYGR